MSILHVSSDRQNTQISRSASKTEKKTTERRGRSFGLGCLCLWFVGFFYLFVFLNRHLIHLINQPCREQVLLLHVVVAGTFRRGPTCANLNQSNSVQINHALHFNSRLFQIRQNKHKMDISPPANCFRLISKKETNVPSIRQRFKRPWFHSELS